MSGPTWTRTICLLLSSALLVAPSAGAQQAVPLARIRYTINENWRFAPGPLRGAETVNFADSSWQIVELPHTWNRDDAFSKSEAYRRGVGWYRKQLALDPAVRGRRLFLLFEGANQVADVFVNGNHVGAHVGGYTAFVFDVTEQLRPGESNLIAVRVDNSHNPDVPPLNADFTFYGGIYRDVWLIATDTLHIDVLDHAAPGVYIETPELSAERARVRVRGTLVNHGTTARHAELLHRVIDPGGRVVATMRQALVLPPGKTSFQQSSAVLPQPLLWSPAQPNLYRVHTAVRAGGRVVDEISNPLGFRWFALDAQRGFLLNGEPLRLYGTNRHQDYAGYGNAVPDGLHRRDVDLIKATGFNFLRLAHYPQDPALLNELDRTGLLAWEEIPVVNMISLSSAFAENAERMLVEMIRQHYNHPSIVFWGYMNEVLLIKPNPLPAGYHEAVLALARRLEQRARQEDPTRATVTAISLDEIDARDNRGALLGLQNLPDVLGLNLYFGWYYRELAGLGAFLDSLHARHPARPLFLSEYGADSDERIHSREPRAFDFSTEHQQRFHETQFPQLRERSYLIGTAVWNQFDFGSKGRHDSKPNLNQKGLFYFDRTPKDIWYYYRAVLQSAPVLHIAARDWPRRAGSRPDDDRHDMHVYSNLPEIELLLNGSSQGKQRPVGATARWSVKLQPGQNRLEARAAQGASVLTDVIDVHYEDRTALFNAAVPKPQSSQVVAVNAGGHYQYVGTDGLLWEADRPYQPGSWGYADGTPRLVHHRIYSSDDDALHQATREGVRSYRFDVPAGEYEITVTLCETSHERAGQRIFDVLVNEQPLFSGIDLPALGRYTAVTRRTRVRTADGVLVRFVARAGEPTVSAISLRKL